MNSDSKPLSWLTAVIRNAYIDHMRAADRREGLPESDRYGADFDTWLAAHDAELREQIVREIVDEAQAMTRSSAHLLGGSSEKNAAYRMGICDGLTGAASIARGEQP